METDSERKIILDTAVKLTCGDRNKQYGDPYDNLTHTAALWNAYTCTTDFVAEDVAHMLALLKIARTLTNEKYHKDNYVDAAAYLAIAGECRAQELTPIDFDESVSQQIHSKFTVNLQ